MAKEIEDKVTLTHITRILEEAVGVGEIRLTNVRMTEAILNAVVGEAALYRLRVGEDTTDVLETMLTGILDGLRVRAD